MSRVLAPVFILAAILTMAGCAELQHDRIAQDQEDAVMRAWDKESAK